MSSTPLVSVIIPTYNYSSVLRYAIQSVLWQTFADFELLVIGDCCTDDSEAVVASFGDARVRWYNLPQNAGQQYAPNNKGLEMASGQFVAYLGHDDLWHPHHLETMVATITARDADVVYAVLAEMASQAAEDVRLIGIGEPEKYDFMSCLRPLSAMHRRDLVEAIGDWRDYRTIPLPPDMDFFLRAWLYRRRFAATFELTAFKFTASTRRKVYVEKPAHEQAAFIQRIETEPDLPAKLLLTALRNHPPDQTLFTDRLAVSPQQLRPGSLMKESRQRRGLSPGAAIPHETSVSIAEDRALLYTLNDLVDITPRAARQQLFHGDTLPVDGLFVGAGWSAVQRDTWGDYWRVIGEDAQIIVTRPAAAQRSVALDVAPDNIHEDDVYQLSLCDQAGGRLSAAQVSERESAVFPMPLQPGESAVFHLQITAYRGAAANPMLRVYSIRWAQPADHEVTVLRSHIERQQRDIDELVLFRHTSLRYWARRLRQGWRRMRRRNGV